MPKKLVLEDILWFIETLKKDKRVLNPEMRLELAAEMIDAIIELRKKNNVQGVRERGHKDSGG